MNLASCCSEQMDVPESICVIMCHYAAKCILEYDRFGAGSVMVWADIHHEGFSFLIIIIIII